MSVDEAGFDSLIQKIFRLRSFDCRQYRESYIKRRLMVRLRAWKVSSFREYSEVLEKHPEEYIKLIDDITINVTQFFRDATVYKAFRETVLPILLQNKKQIQSDSMRIWSCGCASGEEPYSIALCLLENLKKRVAYHKINIFATDIDDVSLNKGRLGIYSKESLAEVPPDIIARYFIPEGEKFKIKEEVKSLVKFTKHDFIRQESFKNLDIVFCRNVMIYLTKEMQTKLLIDFYKSLNNKGFLILGKVEGLMSVNEGLFVNFNLSERIYQKY